MPNSKKSKPRQATTNAVHAALATIAPLQLAEDWDNVGELITGVRDRIGTMLLTIDLTEPVLEEAIDARADMVVAYHPPIFSPLARLTTSTPNEAIALGLAQAGIHVYSPHTALDAAPGGVNDWFSDCLGEGDRRALMAACEQPKTEAFKIITFCPPEYTDRIRDGLAALGAGNIGAYQRCSFELKGTGTFHGHAERSDPAIGQSGQLERVEETRLEMVCPADALAAAIRSIRSFHPYEEPPIEILRLEPRPQRDTGAGRRVHLDRSMSLRGIAEAVKVRTGSPRVQVARAHERPQRHRMIGLCAGAGASLLDEALAQECSVFVTGEMRHHDILRAQADGCSIILAGHTNTERGYLPILAKRLTKLLGDTAPTILVSRKDRDPLRPA